MSNNEPLEHLDLLDTEYTTLLEHGIEPRQYINFLQRQEINKAQVMLEQLDVKATSLQRYREEINAELKLQEALLIELAANSLQPFAIATKIFLTSLVGAAAIAFFSGNKTNAGYALAFSVGAASVGVCCEVAGCGKR